MQTQPNTDQYIYMDVHYIVTLKLRAEDAASLDCKTEGPEVFTNITDISALIQPAYSSAISKDRDAVRTMLA